MDEKTADFLLASSEGYGLEAPRQCYVLKRFAAPGRDDYLLIEVTPPIPARHPHAGGQQLKQIVIAARLNGTSLFPITDWPFAVYVLEPLIENPAAADLLNQDDVALIAWAELYEPGSLKLPRP